MAKKISLNFITLLVHFDLRKNPEYPPAGRFASKHSEECFLTCMGGGSIPPDRVAKELGLTPDKPVAWLANARVGFDELDNYLDAAVAITAELPDGSKYEVRVEVDDTSSAEAYVPLKYEIEATLEGEALQMELSLWQADKPGKFVTRRSNCHSVLYKVITKYHTFVQFDLTHAPKGGIELLNRLHSFNEGSVNPIDPEDIIRVERKVDRQTT
jgi:hypothetical protein